MESERVTFQDCVRFVMPKNREYQFAAIRVVQNFVNGYAVKTVNEDVSGGRATYSFRYQLVMDPEDLNFFIRIGTVLDRMPIKLLDSEVTMLVDMSNARIEAFEGSGKHLTEICGALCGVLCGALPVIRRVPVRRNGSEWLLEPTLSQMEAVQPSQITGIVARAGAVTYLAAAMALGVVEVVGPDEKPGWRTKWVNYLYRRVVVENPDCLTLREEMWVEQAKRSINSAWKEVCVCSGHPVETILESQAMEHT